MSEPVTTVHEPGLYAKMVESRQLSPADAEALARLDAARRPATEAEALQWLAHEYGLTFTALENAEPGRDLTSRFPARVLLKEELLPLREVEGRIEVALSRLFAEPGLDSLNPFTTQELVPWSAPIL